MYLKRFSWGARCPYIDMGNTRTNPHKKKKNENFTRIKIKIGQKSGLALLCRHLSIYVCIS